MAGAQNGTTSADAEVVHKPIPKKGMTEIQRRREYERRMEQDLTRASDSKAAPFKAMLYALWDNDTATRMWQQIEPIIRSGAEGVKLGLARNNRAQVPPSEQ